MEKVIGKLLRLGGWRHALAGTLLFALFVGALLPWQSRRSESYRGETRAADLRLAYGPEELSQMAEAYGPEGRRAYVRDRVTFDLAWPLVYTYFFLAIVGLGLRRAARRAPRWRWLILLVLAPLLFDLLENAGLSAVMLAHPRRLDLVARAASVATSLKWVTMGLVHLLAVGAALAAVAAHLRDKS